MTFCISCRGMGIISEEICPSCLGHGIFIPGIPNYEISITVARVMQRFRAKVQEITNRDCSEKPVLAPNELDDSIGEGGLR